MGGHWNAVIPESFGGKQVVLQAGKYGVVLVLVLLLDENDLRGYQEGLGNSDKVVDSGVKIAGTAFSSYFYGAPTYCKPSSGEHASYFCGINLPMERHTFDQNGELSTFPATKGSDTFLGYGAIPVVSSNGSRAGTAILWTIRSATAGTNKELGYRQAEQLKPTRL